MYTYDHPLMALRRLHQEQPVISQPSQRCYHSDRACPTVEEWYALGQSVPLPASYNTPGVTFDPQADYILAPEVMVAVEKLLSTPVLKHTVNLWAPR